MIPQMWWNSLWCPHLFWSAEEMFCNTRMVVNESIVLVKKLELLFVPYWSFQVIFPDDGMWMNAADEARWVTPRCLHPCRPPLKLLSLKPSKEREIRDSWSREESQSPAMHGEYPLLAHSLIQARVGTPRGPPLPGASSIFISADGAPKC